MGFAYSSFQAIHFFKSSRLAKQGGELVTRLSSHSFLAIGPLRAALLLIAFCPAGIALGDTVIEFGIVSDVLENSSGYSSPGSLSNSASISDEPVTGINKFDPALGTLNSVTLIAELESTYSIAVFALDVIDDQQAHTVDFETNFFEGFIGYSPGGGSSTSVAIGTYYQTTGSCGDDPMTEPCGNFFEEDTSDSDSVVISTELGSFDINDFFGVGPVTTLTAELAVATDGLFTLDNVLEAEADLAATMTVVSVEVVYDYTPVPEPSSGLLLAVAGLVALVRRGHAGE